MSSVIRIQPGYYIHVLDNNTNVTSMHVGPLTFVKQDHQTLVLHPTAMVVVPPRSYCVIANPVQRGADGQPIIDKTGQVKIRHAEKEVRLTQDPFPLYPGEALFLAPTALTVLTDLQAMRVLAAQDYEEERKKGDKIEKVKRVAGDEWMVKGPMTYIPRPEELASAPISAVILNENSALQLRAKKNFTDRKGIERYAGEVWLWDEVGAFIPDVYEEVLPPIQATTLNPSIALHVKARRRFTDRFGREHMAGDEWLVTLDDCESYIPSVNEEQCGTRGVTVLNRRQYCVVLDPVDKNGKQLLGTKELRKGETSFFLHPKERLEKGIEDIYVLRENEALLLSAQTDVTFENVFHKAGEKWMIYGPKDFIPPIEVKVEGQSRKLIPLHLNEGIYVRDLKTGRVRTVKGASYMLKENEVLWEKTLSPVVEDLIMLEATREKNKPAAQEKRDKTKMVCHRVPHSFAVQIYNFENNQSRVVYGPQLAMLEPNETFTELCFSAGCPKKEGQTKSISLFLGPDFMTDEISVETSDHARLLLKLSYNWFFDVDKNSKEDSERIFCSKDFVGDLCKTLSSRIRGAAAASTFDEFHKGSAEIIQKAVFGSKNAISFSNKLVVNNIDVQSVEPIDQRTKEALQKSVQLAIEITTKSQEASAQYESERLDQIARGDLERRKINDQCEAEKERLQFLKLLSVTQAAESEGLATADANAQANAQKIIAEAEVSKAKLVAQSMIIKGMSEVEAVKAEHNHQLDMQQKMDQLELNKSKQLADIEVEAFSKTVLALGPETIKAIAVAGPDMQQKLLNGLGIQSVLITDGANPINLFNAATGLVKK